MTEPVLMANSPSVSWVDSPSGIDMSFIDEVPVIPAKIELAILDLVVESAINRLFEVSAPLSWAFFKPYRGYGARIKKLFRKKILSSFDSSDAIEVLDNAHENDPNLPQGEGEKLYQMLHALGDLDKILEEIELKIASCLKP